MATYAISDIHGALDEFKALLRKIGFRPDGSDELYLLGDFGDWGARSLETILFIKELAEACPHVHPLMGNHELMFLTTILSGYKEGDDDPNALNWLYADHGLVTWKAYLGLTDKEKSDLALWLHSLPLSATVKIGEGKPRTYMLAHAYPYHYDQVGTEEEALQRRVDAVWRRLMLREDPFADYRGSEHYDMFVCGHTITDYYYGVLRLERNWPYRKPGEYVRNRIFRGERFINIDCGAKCMDYDMDSREIIQLAALRAQLAALRLEDEKAFYVRRAPIHLPDITLPEIAFPEFTMPELRMPEVSLPNLPNIQSLAGRQRLYEIPKWFGLPGKLSAEELERILSMAGEPYFRGTIRRREEGDPKREDRTTKEE